MVAPELLDWMTTVHVSPHVSGQTVAAEVAVSNNMSVTHKVEEFTLIFLQSSQNLPFNTNWTETISTWHLCGMTWCDH